MNKILIGFGVIISAVSPLINVVSCGAPDNDATKANKMRDSAAVHSAMRSMFHSWSSISSTLVTSDFTLSDINDVNDGMDVNWRINDLKTKFGLPSNFVWNDFGVRITKVEINSNLDNSKGRVNHSVLFTFSKGNVSITQGQVWLSTYNDATKAAENAKITFLRQEIINMTFREGDYSIVSSTMNKTQVKGISNTLTPVNRPSDLQNAIGFSKFSDLNFQGVTIKYINEGVNDLIDGSEARVELQLSTDAFNIQRVDLKVRSNEISDSEMGQYYANEMISDIDNFVISSSTLNYNIKPQDKVGFVDVLGTTSFDYREYSRWDSSISDVYTNVDLQYIEESLDFSWVWSGSTNGYLTPIDTPKNSNKYIDFKAEVIYKNIKYTSENSFTIFEKTSDEILNMLLPLTKLFATSTTRESMNYPNTNDLSDINNNTSLTTASAFGGKLWSSFPYSSQWNQFFWSKVDYDTQFISNDTTNKVLKMKLIIRDKDVTPRFEPITTDSIIIKY